jgi:2-polyprenyl-3-methyl-5-hydroxy-6-metoxy-1,4-benzoquinol methylase
MDIATRTFYARDAAACAARYEDADVHALHDILRSLAKKGLHVLDIGGGSGRDAAFLAGLGCCTIYTDGCKEMVDEAIRFHPELAHNSRVAVFPLSEDDPLTSESFDLVLCVAVIMHLGDTCLMQLASQLAELIAPGGHLVLSHSAGRRDVVNHRDQAGRFFRERPAADVRRVFEMAGFETERQTEDADGMGRDSIRWITHVLRKTA